MSSSSPVPAPAGADGDTATATSGGSGATPNVSSPLPAAPATATANGRGAPPHHRKARTPSGAGSGTFFFAVSPTSGTVTPHSVQSPETTPGALSAPPSNAGGGFAGSLQIPTGASGGGDSKSAIGASKSLSNSPLTSPALSPSHDPQRASFGSSSAIAFSGPLASSHSTTSSPQGATAAAGAGAGAGGSTSGVEPATITLNVGGHVFVTHAQTLLRHNSRLAALASAHQQQSGSASKALFIDRDGTSFRYILNYLRDGEIVLPPNITLHQQLVREAQYYQLHALQLCLEQSITQLTVHYHQQLTQHPHSQLHSPVSAPVSPHPIASAAASLSIDGTRALSPATGAGVGGGGGGGGGGIALLNPLMSVPAAAPTANGVLFHGSASGTALHAQRLSTPVMARAVTDTKSIGSSSDESPFTASPHALIAPSAGGVPVPSTVPTRIVPSHSLVVPSRQHSDSSVPVATAASGVTSFHFLDASHHHRRLSSSLSIFDPQSLSSLAVMSSAPTFTLTLPCGTVLVGPLCCHRFCDWTPPPPPPASASGAAAESTNDCHNPHNQHLQSPPPAAVATKMDATATASGAARTLALAVAHAACREMLMQYLLARPDHHHSGGVSGGATSVVSTASSACVCCNERQALNSAFVHPHFTELSSSPVSASSSSAPSPAPGSRPSTNGVSFLRPPPSAAPALKAPNCPLPVTSRPPTDGVVTGVTARRSSLGGSPQLEASTQTTPNTALRALAVPLAPSALHANGGAANHSDGKQLLIHPNGNGSRHHRSSSAEAGKVGIGNRLDHHASGPKSAQRSPLLIGGSHHPIPWINLASQHAPGSNTAAAPSQPSLPVPAAKPAAAVLTFPAVLPPLRRPMPSPALIESLRSKSSPPRDPDSVFYSWAEIRRHCTRESCWIVVHDRVLDVTKFLEHHPAGMTNILKNGGTDATVHYEFHSGKAQSYFDKFQIGRVEGTSASSCSLQ